MPVSLLDSQLEILEPLETDERHICVDVAGSKEDVLSRAIADIGMLFKT